MNENPLTDQEKERNIIVQSLQKSPIIGEFVNKVYTKLIHDHEIYCSKVTGKNFTIFLSQFHQYAPTVWPLLFGTAATEVEKSVCVELVWAIKSEILKGMANKSIECQKVEV